VTRPTVDRLLKVSIVVAMLVLAATGGRIIEGVSRLFAPPTPANIIIVAPAGAETV
jgi:hypothetical protein